MLRKILFKLGFVKTRGFGKTRFPKQYQKSVGMNAAEFLHENSKELVQVLKDNNIIPKIETVFEIGSGPGRNLFYLSKEKNLQLHCSDLFKKESLKNMDSELKKIITFFEGDSEEIALKNPVKNLDLVLISDHLMHLQYKKAEIILNQINDTWRPQYILLREIKKEYEDISHPRLYHNYEILLTKYDLVYENVSNQDKNYFIWLLKKK